MHAFAGKRIEEYGQGRHKGFSLAGRHFGNFSLMQHDTAYKLHVIMDHVPCDSVSAGHPAVLPHSLVTDYFHKVVRCRQLTVVIGCTYGYRGVLLESARS